ncbi:hypothetical protein [Arthrobacter sedimenti]|uniref:hypothetical protein n=1 Tax=Arthrobacter sedimenti TaxID=2694931 RepID=UPI00111FB290|nr:hypothetical protein [Arthrobacter sedimenti]
MRVLLDTNIVSKMKQGQPVTLPAGELITTSVVLQELFLAQKSDESGFAYALPVVGRHAMSALYFRPHVKLRPISREADKLLLDFNQEHPSRVEFGHLSITQVYKRNLRLLLSQHLHAVGKTKRRLALENYDYLHGIGVSAIPLGVKTAQLGLDLYQDFKQIAQPKKNLRNTLNDLFILAMAVDANASLITDDRLLATFAGQVSPRVLEERGEVYVSTPREPVARRRSTGNKGYKNTQWRAKVL